MSDTSEESEYDLRIHQNPDARAWGKFFMEIYNKDPTVPLDEERMTAWFANAMMAMHDYLHGNRPINGDHLQWLLDHQEPLEKEFEVDWVKLYVKDD